MSGGDYYLFFMKNKIISLFMNARSKKSGFTLIEILVVIGIIALLATIVIVAINPARQFAQARNTQRESNVNTILNAIGQNIADNKGIFNCAGANPLGNVTASTSIVLGTTGVAPGVPNAVFALAVPTTDLAKCLAPVYIPTFPTDPDAVWLAVSNYSGYEVSVDIAGRVTVCAPRSMSETQISIPGPATCVKR